MPSSIVAPSHSDVRTPVTNGGKSTLYVANLANGDSTVSLYTQGEPSLLRTITQGVSYPEGLAIDGLGHLFVANSLASRPGSGRGTVTVYANRGKKLTRTISRGVDHPLALAYDSSNNLYVADHFAVTVYAHGKPSVSHRIRVRGPESLAVDASGNLYVGSGNGLGPVMRPVVSVAVG
jgi:DNA-binding beta-propeller fold protein YncE